MEAPTRRSADTATTPTRRSDNAATLRNGNTASGTSDVSAAWLPRELRERMTIAEALPTRGSEADLYILSDEHGQRYAAKVYRYGIAPKTEVLRRILSAEPEHVVRLIEHGEEEGRTWELLEYIEHATLREIMHRAVPSGLTEPTLRTVLAQLAKAVDALHGLGLEHRDLKPENVLVRCKEPLEIVVADWGIASVLDATVHFTASARTIRYAPPEAVGTMTKPTPESTTHTVSAIERTRWDAWSIGMIMIECASGTHPFADTPEAVIAHRLATQPTDALSERVHDPRWRKLCRGLTRRTPRERWGVAEIERWLADADDPGLDVAADEHRSTSASIDFDGETIATPEALGKALAKDSEKAQWFWKRRYTDVMTWLVDSLGESKRGRALETIERDRALDLDTQVFGLIRVLWPKAPIVVKGRTITRRALQDLARKAWSGDDTAAAELVSISEDAIIGAAANADPSGEIASIAKTWTNTTKLYVKERRHASSKTGTDLSIPKWVAGRAEAQGRAKPGTLIEAGRIAAWREAGGGPLTARTRAAMLGASIGANDIARDIAADAERSDQTLKTKQTTGGQKTRRGAQIARDVARALTAQMLNERKEAERANREQIAREAARAQAKEARGTERNLRCRTMRTVLSTSMAITMVLGVIWAIEKLLDPISSVVAIVYAVATIAVGGLAGTRAWRNHNDTGLASLRGLRARRRRLRNTAVGTGLGIVAATLIGAYASEQWTQGAQRKATTQDPIGTARDAEAKAQLDAATWAAIDTAIEQETGIAPLQPRGGDRQAIRRWQITRDVEPTGYLHPAQARGLRRLGSREDRELGPGGWRDCEQCPEMVWSTGGKAAGLAIARYETTLEEWADFALDEIYRRTKTTTCKLTGEKNENQIASFTQGPLDPMVCISYSKAEAYTEWLRQRTGYNYRLPSEEEWETAAAAEMESNRWFTHEFDPQCLHTNAMDDASVKIILNQTGARCNDGYAYTAITGSYKPNALGIHDMTGNVWEYTSTRAWDKPVLRGGSWYNSPAQAKTQARSLIGAEGNTDAAKSALVGFRVARESPQAQEGKK